MKFFDTHIHLTDFANIEPTSLLERLKKANIEKCICVSTQPDDWEKTAFFARSFPLMVIPSFGLHPWYADKFNTNTAQQLENYLKEFPTAFIGECGFDRIKNPNFETQSVAFDTQLTLALRYRRPVILHMVKADIWLNSYWQKLPQNCIFHSFSGSLELLKQILKINCYISVNKKFFNKKDAENIIIKTPADKLLIETDAPFQSMPEDLSAVVQKIAEIKGGNLFKTVNKLYENTVNVISYYNNITY